jgi:hypothetical protein
MARSPALDLVDDDSVGETDHHDTWIRGPTTLAPAASVFHDLTLDGRSIVPNALVDNDVVKRAVQVACRAPSLHNSQPWRWVAAGSQLLLYLDDDRLLPSTDKTGREALISCGAVLDHLRVALAAAGWATRVDRFPDSDDPDHLATLHLSALSAVTDEQHRRAEAISHRRTDRLPFGAPDDWERIKPVLRGAAAASGIHLDVIADELRPELARASRLTESLRMYDTSYHTELNWWTGHFENSEGIPSSSLLSATEDDRVDIGRDFPVGPHHERAGEQLGRDQSAVLVLSTDQDSRSEALRSGEALSAILLDCTLAGMASCTLTQLTELWSSRDLIRSLTGRAALPQLLIRVGEPISTAATPPMTPRRRLEDVLTFEV